ncbi:MAG: hypothetical protein QXT25_03565 [Candidatus Anstonellaceae archaeon]
MKAQYFSFDAIVAAVIVIIAMTVFASYWFGTQSIAESKNNPLYADALRVAESLMSPGSPSNWTLYVSGPNFNQIRQIGFAKDFFMQEFDKDKIEKFEAIVSTEAGYIAAGKLLRTTTDYFIVVEQTDNPAGFSYYFGKSIPSNASEVVVAHQGAVLEGKPVRLQVYLWRR